MKPEDVVRCKSWRNGLLQQVFDLSKISLKAQNNSLQAPNEEHQTTLIEHSKSAAVVQKLELRQANERPIDTIMLAQE